MRIRVQNQSSVTRFVSVRTNRNNTIVDTSVPVYPRAIVDIDAEYVHGLSEDNTLNGLNVLEVVGKAKGTVMQSPLEPQAAPQNQNQNQNQNQANKHNQTQSPK